MRKKRIIILFSETFLTFFQTRGLSVKWKISLTSCTMGTVAFLKWTLEHPINDYIYLPIEHNEVNSVSLRRVICVRDSHSLKESGVLLYVWLFNPIMKLPPRYSLLTRISKVLRTKPLFSNKALKVVAKTLLTYLQIPLFLYSNTRRDSVRGLYSNVTNVQRGKNFLHPLEIQ